MGKKQIMMFIGGIICAVVITVVGFLLSGTEQSIDTVTAGKVREIAYIKNANGERVDVKICREHLAQYHYRRYFGKKGNTAQRSYYCYAVDDTRLLVFTDLGNKNLLQVTVNGKNSVYRAVDKKK